MTRRNISIIAKVRAGATLASVGEEYGITRERVRQICKKKGVKSSRSHGKVKGQKCSVLRCGKGARGCYRPFKKAKSKPYCGMHLHRMKNWGYPGPAKPIDRTPGKCKERGCPNLGDHGHGMCSRHYALWAYYNLPGRKESVLRQAREWTKRALATNPEYRAKYRAYQKEYRKRRLASDPEYRERYNTRRREQRQRRMADPEYREKVRAQNHARYLRRKAQEPRSPGRHT